MAVLERGEIVLAVFDRMATLGGASKILMSQRQYNAQRTYWGELQCGADYTMFGAPIVICPDCDLYVVPPTADACYGSGMFTAKITDEAPVGQKVIVASDDGWVKF